MFVSPPPLSQRQALHLHTRTQLTVSPICIKLLRHKDNKAPRCVLTGLYSPVVSLCSHLCWRQLLQVPLQPERGVCPGRVRPVPGNDRRENLTFDPRGDLTPLLFLWRKGPTLHFFFSSWQTLWKGASREGRTKGAKHRPAQRRPDGWRHQQPLSSEDWLANQALQKRESGTMAIFTTSSEEFPKEGYFWIA